MIKPKEGKVGIKLALSGKGDSSLLASLIVERATSIMGLWVESMVPMAPGNDVYQWLVMENNVDEQSYINPSVYSVTVKATKPPGETEMLGIPRTYPLSILLYGQQQPRSIEEVIGNLKRMGFISAKYTRIGRLYEMDKRTPLRWASMSPEQHTAAEPEGGAKEIPDPEAVIRYRTKVLEVIDEAMDELGEEDKRLLLKRSIEDLEALLYPGYDDE